MTTTLPLDRQLCFSLYAANMAINRAYKPVLDALGITYPQYLVLLALWDQDERTIGGIAERLSLESSTITPLVKRLEQAGHVTRERNPDDEREVRVHLTSQGKAMRERCGCLGEALSEKIGLPIADLRRLKRDVDVLRAALSRTA